MFENELTFFKAILNKEEEQFHQRYEDAIEKISKELGRRYPFIIDGKERISNSSFPDISPIDKGVVGYVSKAKEEDVRDAIRSSKDSFKEWSKLDYKERVKIMKRTADIISKQKYELASLVTYENGKNRYEAIADVDEAIDFLRYYAHIMEENNGYIRRMNSAYPDEECYSILKPYGVFVVISPFNFPIAITTGMCSGALLTGNTVVLKPSSDTPISAIRLVDIFEEAGVIDGAINIITGFGSSIGNVLVNSKEIDGIAFTGSRDVGLSIYNNASKIKPKPIITEMGGKNSTIVSKDADLDKAVRGVARAAFGYSGQKCSACSRVIVHKSIKDEFIAKLRRFTSTLKVGDPRERDTFVGPVINENAYDKYKEVIHIAKRDGIVYGGNIMDLNGYYVEPTIIDGLDNKHRFLREELFLPILAVITYEQFGDAIKLANNTDYGLTAGIFSNNEHEIDRFFDEVEAGVLYANREKSATTGAMVGAQPFVGWKYSGTSGKGAGGRYYLEQFLREQSRTK